MVKSTKPATLDRLIQAINRLGFAVTLTPLGALTSAPTVTPKAPAKSSGLASRIGADAPDVETVEVHGVTITRVVGSRSAEAPLGRDISGKALAPFGMLADGSRPRKSPAGRPPAEAPAAPAPKAAAAPKAAPKVAPKAPEAGGFSLDMSDLGGFDLGDLGLDVAPPAPPAVEPDADDVLADLEAELSGF